MRPAGGSLIFGATQSAVAAPESNRPRRRATALMAVSAMLLIGVGTPLVLLSAPAGANQVATLQQRAQYIAGEIQAATTQLQILDESYLQAEGRVSLFEHQVARATAAIGGTERSLEQDRAHLREVAIEAYVTGGASQSLSVVFNGTEQTAGMQQAYLQAASGNLDESETTVLINQRSLTLERATLAHTEQIAKANAEAIASDVSQEQALTAQLNNEESQVKGQLAAAVAEVQREQAAAYAAATKRALAAAEKRQAAEAAAAAQASANNVAEATSTPATTAPASAQAPSSAPPPAAAPTTGDSSGQIAVDAAQGQRGVPYVWGGATPGVGFDCSGLTMWAWSQAGVQLAHGATEQYYEIQHVSMADLQPGDLIFYGDASLLYHVVMYIGGGMVVQAEETGTNVMDTPIPPGAYGAGQP
ncbi:MAG: NlpC/P60 family protein [Acidimicrobiales bacterium]